MLSSDRQKRGISVDSESRVKGTYIKNNNFGRRRKLGFFFFPLELFLSTSEGQLYSFKCNLSLYQPQSDSEDNVAGLRLHITTSDYFF